MRSLLILIALGEVAIAQPRLDVGLEQQSRVEHLSHDFRAASTGDATAFLMRTLARAEAASGAYLAGVELRDSRVYASEGTPLNATLVNPLEILQAYIGLEKNGFDVRAGRITIDLGTRRIVARNRFRNTINGFTGVDATWT